MNIHPISCSPALSTVHCSDPEKFGAMLPDIRRRLLPLGTDFSFSQAELQLGHLRLIVVERPPCISEGFLANAQMGIALSMDDSPGLKLDGISLAGPALVTHGAAIPHHIFQPSKLMIAAVLLPDEDGDRGWPERVPAARVDRIRPAAIEHLRSTIRDVLQTAALCPPSFLQQNMVSGMQLSLLDAVDHAFLTAPHEMEARPAIRKYVRICRLVDEFICNDTLEIPSSAEIADAVGVTIRTLHNAMIAVKGMSLQRFMMLNRLWAVRAALLRAGPEDLIKTIALDHRFWHLGRFSQTYRAFFGESPSDTMLRRPG
jgi:AraC family ethanolamine operon transcriptional activator